MNRRHFMKTVAASATRSAAITIRGFIPRLNGTIWRLTGTGLDANTELFRCNCLD